MSKALWQSKLFGMKFCLLICFILGVSACGSSGPATSYYSLFASSSEQVDEQTKKPVALGVTLVNLPGYLQTSSIVSRTSGQKLNVSGFHAWAEPFEEAITRTVAGNLRNTTGIERVVAFPWDMRLRPNQQLQVDIEQLDGIRGESVGLIASWTIYSVSEKKIIYSGAFSEQETLATNSYDEYVQGINTLLNKFSKSIADSLSSS